MATTDNTLIKLLLDSKALSIWNHDSGPVFWGAAKVPMPFYVNTELMLGEKLSTILLEKITAICASSHDPIARATELEELILSSYKNEPHWQHINAAMIAKAEEAFVPSSYKAVSGGERRDWLFSIPFAEEVGLKHIYLFKDGSLHSDQPLKAKEKTLHVCDLVNNAASHFDAWLPMLEKHHLECAGTLCVNSRGSKGVERLEAAGYKVAAINCIARPFFDRICADGLITQELCDELALFLSSYKEWAERYLMDHAALFHVDSIDTKSFERLRSFFTEDPWGLRTKYAAFFAEIEKQIEARPKAHAA